MRIQRWQKLRIKKCFRQTVQSAIEQNCDLPKRAIMTAIWKPVEKESAWTTLVFLMVNRIVKMLSKTMRRKKHTPKIDLFFERNFNRKEKIILKALIDSDVSLELLVLMIDYFRMKESVINKDSQLDGMESDRLVEYR